MDDVVIHNPREFVLQFILVLVLHSSSQKKCLFMVCCRLFRLGVHLLVTPWLSVRHTEIVNEIEIICLPRYAINLMQCNGGTILIK